MQRHRFLFIALGLLTVWRALLLPVAELHPIEAKAAFQAAHGLQNGWWESGPALAWTARLGLAVAGHHEWGVRLWAPLCSLITSLTLWGLARGFFDRTVASWAVVILNVTPAFHLASIHLTPSTLMMPLVALLALFLRRGLMQAHPLHWAWWAAGLCLAGIQHVTSAGALALLAAACALGIPRRRRHHLNGFGFLILLLCWLPAGFSWMIWQNQHEWPVASLHNWQPVVTIIPSLFRWVLLLSPLGLTFAVLATRLAVPMASRITALGLPLGFALPLALADFFWGTASPWPDTGFSVWMIFIILLVAHRLTVHGGIESGLRISLRTAMVALAALQSVLISHTDLTRSLGLSWGFETHCPSRPDYARFFTRDPSGPAHGWSQAADLVAAVLRETVDAQAPDDGARWFVIAENDRLAAMLEFYLPSSVAVFRPDASHPRVHALQTGAWDHPFAWWPRYDAVVNGTSPYTGLHALFVTDQPDNREPPPAVTVHFDSAEPLSQARFIHGGREVRSLKIFACHRYQSPEL